MLKRFLVYYKPHKKMFFYDMFASLVMSLLAIVYPIITRLILNRYVPEKNTKLILVCGAIILGVYLLRMFLKWFIQYYGHMIGVKIQAQMRSDMFRKLETLPYTYYDSHETGKIITRMTNDLADVTELAHHAPENLIICSITIIGSCIYLLTINALLTFIVFLSVPLLVVVATKMRNKMISAFKETRQSLAEINANMTSSVEGIRVTKAFTNAEKEQEKFEVGNKKFIKARSKSYMAMAQYHSLSSFITDIFNIIVLIVGGLILCKQTSLFTLADYSAFAAAVSLFISPVTTLINFAEQFSDGVTGFQRFLEIIDEDSEFEKPGAITLNNVKGDITFENVYFSYGEEKNILNNLSIFIPHGQSVALVGPSGGGKTTICHTIPRFYDIQEGKICIDGIDVKDCTLESLRRNIGIVQQDVFLFGGTIRDNIMYGRLDATEEEMIMAAKRANIHDYIMTLPNGYETEIGERGVRLSGGQKQRLSIARVFLKNPPILILDEATSALDNTTEILIQQALDELCKGRTTLVVAHRLSTIKNADKIVVISEGQIIEQGTHDELIEKQGIYKELYSLQFRLDRINP